MIEAWKFKALVDDVKALRAELQRTAARLAPARIGAVVMDRQAPDLRQIADERADKRIDALIGVGDGATLRALLAALDAGTATTRQHQGATARLIRALLREP